MKPQMNTDKHKYLKVKKRKCEKVKKLLVTERETFSLFRVFIFVLILFILSILF